MITDKQVIQFVFDHYGLIGVGGYIFLWVVNSMPTPTEKNWVGYVWLFNLLHALSGSWMRIEKVRNAVTHLRGRLNGNGTKNETP